MKLIFKLSIVAILLTGCSEKSKDEKIMSEIESFQSNLKTTLQSAIKKDGLVGAIEVCQKASPLAEKEFSSNKMVIRRVSQKTRNILHKPDDFEMTVLKIWQSKLVHGKKPAVFTTETEDGYRLMKPIYVKGACLQCHGENIAPAVRQKITALYPGDKAISYKEGDLRGAFSVILKK